jgi:uncharacterized protein YlxW (UPF0749 family)
MFFIKALGLVKSFILANWKWLLPLAAVVLGFLWTKDHYYDLGRETERTKWEKLVQKEKERNEKLSNSLLDSVDTFSKAVETRNEDRVQKETIRETRINTIVEEKPIYKECKIDQEVLNEQNALKAMGPKL